MNTAYPAFDHPRASHSTSFSGKDEFAIDLQRRHLDVIANAVHHAGNQMYGGFVRRV